jgi:hypothetical protein
MEENHVFDSPVHGFSFKLDGKSAQHFDIKYEVELSEGPARTASNGYPAGIPSGRWDDPNRGKARRLKVQVLSRAIES